MQCREVNRYKAEVQDAYRVPGGLYTDTAVEAWYGVVSLLGTTQAERVVRFDVKRVK
jgi:hypothetical protein